MNKFIFLVKIGGRMDKKEISLTITKAIVNTVPWVGGAIASIIEDCVSSRKEERLKVFLKDFSNDMKKSQENFVEEYIKGDEFLDIFENIFVDIMKTRSEEKRCLLKNLLVNSCTIKNTSYEKTEEFQHLIDVISLTGILTLSAFYKHKDIYMNTNENDLNKIWDEIILQTKIEDRSILLDYIGELESRSLIESFRNNFYSIESGVSLVDERPYITVKGIEFYKYIMNIN